MGTARSSAGSLESDLFLEGVVARASDRPTRKGSPGTSRSSLIDRGLFPPPPTGGTEEAPSGGPALEEPAAGHHGMETSLHVRWHYRAGVCLAVHHLRRNPVPVVETPLEELPRLSRWMIRLALRLSPAFLDRADLHFPIIVAGRGWYQIALDGRHRISKAIWVGHGHLPTVRVPWWHALELLVPGIFEAEWLLLFLRGELRTAGQRWSRSPLPPSEEVRFGDRFDRGGPSASGAAGPAPPPVRGSDPSRG